MHVGGDLYLTVGGEQVLVASPVVRVLSPDAPDDPGFVGRADEQAVLLRVLAPPGSAAPGGPAVPVVALSAVAGLGGIGKSALARTVALTASGRGWFPGGVAWVDMRGFDPDPATAVRPAQLWAALLTALGVPEDRIPTTEPAHAAAYHALLDQLAAQDRRVLLVFDNVASAEQVAPLLPMPNSAATRHRFLLTSRQTLAELPAQQLTLDVLDIAAALHLLTSTVSVRCMDDHRIEDDPDSSRRLVELCAGLPLAIVIVGALLAAEPDLPVAELAAELADATVRIAGLTYGPDLAVGTVFAVSHQRLDDDQRTVFASFSVTPGSDAALPLIAAAANLTLECARTAVRHLQRAHLLEPVLPARRSRRWRMHDLVRLYAREQLPQEAAVDAAVRALEWYRSSTDVAWKRFVENVDAPGGEVFPTPGAALQWVLDERVGLVDLVTRTDDNHAVERVLLAADLVPFLERAHLVDDFLQVAESAVRLSVEQDLPAWNRAVAHGNLAKALLQAERLGEAIPALFYAGQLMQDAQDVHGEATTRMNLGIIFNELGQHGAAQAALGGVSATFHRLGKTMGEACASLNMGNALLGQDTLDDAFEMFRSARGLFEQLEDPHGCGHAWGGIGRVHRKRGELPEAADAFRRAAGALADAGDQHSEALARGDLGDVLAAAGDVAGARTAYTQSADLYATVNDTDKAERVRTRAAALPTDEPSLQR